jgi:putative transposase
MKFETGKYYHLYNRSNNKEIVFHEKENYPYFLQQYQEFVSQYFTTFAYCLMPTHFHFLVKVDNESEEVNTAIGRWLSSYTKAINKRYERQGSLFQPHTKAKNIDDESYLLTLITYIHQNPVRAGLVNHCSKWEHSSYQTYIGLNENRFVDTSLLLHYFKSKESYAKYADELLTAVRKEYWI